MRRLCNLANRVRQLPAIVDLKLLFFPVALLCQLSRSPLDRRDSHARRIRVEFARKRFLYNLLHAIDMEILRFFARACNKRLKLLIFPLPP